MTFNFTPQTIQTLCIVLFVLLLSFGILAAVKEARKQKQMAR